uniref:Tyrosine kinase receptor Cad96Ca n=3 Tax=Bactrocera latifrons TaxID=174628 RepID=A0A0K8VRL3_BACLA
MYNQKCARATELIVVVLLFTVFSSSNGKNLVIPQRGKSDIFNSEYERVQQKSMPMEFVNVSEVERGKKINQRLQPRSVKYKYFALESGTDVSISSTIVPLQNSTELDTDEKTSGDTLSMVEALTDPSFITPTTRRPVRLSTSSNISSQERERRLMMVLAARRNALPRVGVRTSLGTTERSSSLETTSKAPGDVRSDCLKNCTKNFTRRTTASCMRKCSNLTRTKNGTIIIHESSLTGSATLTTDRDNNEILFTDESSHGLFIVAKGQNDTSNHIQDVMKNLKVRPKNKDLSSVTITSSSIEEDDIQPYLYFGEKLPPIKPGTLKITSVSEGLPRLLGISAKKLGSTTPSSHVSSSTLTAVERSRSRYKYRDRGYNYSRRSSTHASAITSGGTKSGLIFNNESIASFIKENNEQNMDQSVVLQFTKLPSVTSTVVSSTPLLITVSDESNETSGPIQTTTEFTKNFVSDSPITLYRTTLRVPSANATMKTFVRNTTVPNESIIKITSRAFRKLSPVSPTVRLRTVDEEGIRNPDFLNQKVTQEISSHETVKPTTNNTISRTIVKEDIEKLRALGPSLTQEIKNDENIVIFLNQSSRDRSNAEIEITDKPGEILHPTLKSRHSYENPITETPSMPSESSSSNSNEDMEPSLVGVIETAPIKKQTQLEQTNINRADIKYTFVANGREVSLDMRRVNIATMVLAGIGIIPLCALTLYLVRSYIFRRTVKIEEDFDVCIGDQQPISPVKKLDSKFQNKIEKENYEIDHHRSDHPKAINKVTSRKTNEDMRFDEQCSVTSEQEFDRSNIRLKSLLGEGNFGQVWKAEADNLSGHFGGTRIVAVKTIRKFNPQSSLKEEADIMRKLGSHQNVVTLLGVCLEIEPHMLIMEYAMRGRLLSLLRAARSAVNILPASVPGGRSSTPLSPRTLGGFALDIACGMEYIAEKRIVHRDLAARNVLLDHNGVCKICDFGMSIDLDGEYKQQEVDLKSANKIISSNTKRKLDFGSRFIINHWNNNFNTNQISTKDAIEKKTHTHDHSHAHDSMSRRPALPIRWMAPEALQYHIFTHETDVWAFGIVLWEISTLGSTPYANLTGREVIRRVPNGLRPELPKESRLEFYNLMTRCWHKDCHLRPSFSYARQEISRSLHKWEEDDSAESDYMDVSGFSEDMEHGMVYFNQRISEFECEI